MACKPIIVKNNIKGTITYLSGSIVMSLLSLMCLFIDASDVRGWVGAVYRNDVTRIMVKALFIVGVVFFAYAVVYQIRRLKNPKDVLVVNDQGITDQSSAIAVGFVPWKDVKKINLEYVMGNTFIEVELYNEEAYIKKAHIVQSLFMKLNRIMGHQLICITLNSTGVSPNKIFEDIKDWLLLVKGGEIPQE